MIATITFLEFAAASPILAVFLAFIFAVTVVSVFQSLAHMFSGTPVPPPELPFDKEDE